MDMHHFVGSIIGGIIAEAWERLTPCRFERVHVLCGNDGAVYVTDDDETWSRVKSDGVTRCEAPDPSPNFVLNLSGFHTRDQWAHQLRDPFAKLPILVEANGWIDSPRPGVR